MHHVAALMHSSARPAPGLAATLLPGSLHPVLLLRRAADGSSADVTADIALAGPADLEWLLGYRLFRSLAGDSWLHRSWEDVGAFAIERLCRERNVAVIAAMHLPATVGSTNPPHIHLMAPTRELQCYGFVEWQMRSRSSDGAVE